MIQLKVATIFFILYFIYSVNCFCENKDALKDVVVRVHESRKSKGSNYYGNLQQFQQFVMIHVNKANVTDLCEGMIKNFHYLEVLNLINVNISRIQPNAFQNVSSLTELSLAVNNISELVDGSFNNLESLVKLYLSENGITSIQPGVFHNLMNLEYLYLDRNHLTQISEDLLSGNSLLKVLDLRYNVFETVDKTTFAQLQLSHSKPVTIYLGHNNIKEVYPTVFTFKNPVNLHLENNNLNTITDLFYGVSRFSVLFLNSNKFNCLSDDVIENVKKTAITVYLLSNPISCGCQEILDSRLSQGDVEQTSGHLIYNSSIICDHIVL